MNNLITLPNMLKLGWFLIKLSYAILLLGWVLTPNPHIAFTVFLSIYSLTLFSAFLSYKYESQFFFKLFTWTSHAVYYILLAFLVISFALALLMACLGFLSFIF